MPDTIEATELPAPWVGTVPLHRLHPEHITVESSHGVVWVRLGGVVIHGVGDTEAEQRAHLAAVGRAIAEAAS